MTEISDRFPLAEVDHQELIEIFTLRYGTCWRVAERQIAFPAHRDHQLRLELRHGGSSESGLETRSPIKNWTACWIRLKLISRTSALLSSAPKSCLLIDLCKVDFASRQFRCKSCPRPAMLPCRNNGRRITPLFLNIRSKPSGHQNCDSNAAKRMQWSGRGY